MSTYSPYTDTEEFTYYLTTPETIIKDQWYYTINDTPYPTITTTTLLTILYETTTKQPRKQRNKTKFK
ncbi:hypothetical protein [Vulcanisaeta souniana]|nr:hypothetical protein [Vulcanisaeta souniana]BDR93329.1 hypothetical protein Vsou_24220 [Vulcanisaeta souniana JCM 11219]